MRGLLALFLAAALGGCLSSSPGSVLTSTPATEAPLAAAGVANASSPPAMPQPSSTPVQYGGTTDTGACYFAVTTGDCVTTQEGKDTARELKLDGRPVSLKGTLTWSSAVPGKKFFAYVCARGAAGHGAACPLKAATGPSPIALDFDLSGFNATDTLLLLVESGVAVCCPVPAGAIVSTPADFKVDASLTTLRAGEG